MTTYRDMTLEHLGDNATENDLAAFRRACVVRSKQEDETAQETTDWMWGDGDFLPRVFLYVDYDCATDEDLTDSICWGEHDSNRWQTADE